MLTSSVSKIQNYYDWVTGKFYATEAKVIDSIKGVWTSSASTEIGSVVDSYIMDGLSGTNDYESLSKELKVTINKESIPKLDEWIAGFKETYPIYSCQPSDTKVYSTKMGDLHVTMRGDMLTPNKVFDVKTSKNSFDPMDFISRLQGHFYCDAFEVDEMVYACFLVSHETMRVNFKGEISQPKVPTDYLLEIINSYLAYVKNKDLLNYITK